MVEHILGHLGKLFILGTGIEKIDNWEFLRDRKESKN